MLSTLKTAFPSHLYMRLKPVVLAAKQQIARIDRFVDRRALSREQFVELLESLGFRSGATVMVHSSMRAVRRRVPNLSVEELISLLQRLVQPNGTLLMPTFPFAGKQADYVKNQSRFSLRNTPSKTGALTEVFRNMPGVVRSLHPTHPVAAWGRHAEKLVATHHEGSTFGTNSPFYRIQEHDGVVVGLGTRMQNALTILHVAEDLNPASRELAFDPAIHTVIVEDESREIPFRLQVMRTDVTREYQRVERILLYDGVLKYVRVKGLHCAMTQAEAFISRTLELAAENAYLLRRIPVAQ